MMKNNINKICLLTLILTVISIIFILLMGKTYTTSFEIINKKYNFSLDNNTGSVEVLEEKVDNNKYIVKVKSKQPGKVSLIMDYGDYREQRELYVHKTMVITDNNFFGYSKGSEIIPISISIILSFYLYLLIKKYKKSTKENLYQYKNVAYLGIIIFTSVFSLNHILSIINYQGIYDTINKTINSMSFLSIILFPIALITFILVTISNIILLKKEGKSLKNLLGLFLGILICLLTLLPNYIYGVLQKSQTLNIYNLNSIGPYLYNFVESLVYLTVAYLECILIGTIIISLKSVKKKVAYNKDYIIILGCQIKKDCSLTPLLKGRVDRALDFRNKQLNETGKDLIFIPSGGKGNDEVISESDAMKNYLLSQGIKENNILIEDQSKSTYENIKFSNKLIRNKNANIAFSTTNYHVFRAGLLATEQGLKLDGLGSKTKTYFWINAFIREFIGTLYSEKKKHIMIFILILTAIILMIGVTYLANNL